VRKYASLDNTIVAGNRSHIRSLALTVLDKCRWGE